MNTKTLSKLPCHCDHHEKQADTGKKNKFFHKLTSKFYLLRAVSRGSHVCCPNIWTVRESNPRLAKYFPSSSGDVYFKRFPRERENLGLPGMVPDAITFAITWPASGNATTQRITLPCFATRTEYVAAFQPGHRTGEKHARLPKRTKPQHERSGHCCRRERSSSAFMRK